MPNIPNWLRNGPKAPPPPPSGRPEFQTHRSSSFRSGKSKGSRSNHRNHADHHHHHHNHGSDEMSEVTVDSMSATRHNSPSSQHVISPKEVSVLLEHMTNIKIELANVKADADKYEWKYKRLLEQKEQSDKRVEELETENHTLQRQVHNMEKQIMILNMDHTSSTHHHHAHHTISHHDHSHGDDNTTMTGASSTSNGTKSYRCTILEDAADDADVDRTCTTGAWEERVGGSSAGLVSPDSTMNVFEFSKNGGMHLINDSFSAADLNDVTLHSCSPQRERIGSADRTVATATTEEVLRYPEDDPFATADPMKSNHNSHSSVGSAWWHPWSHPSEHPAASSNAPLGKT